MNIKNRTLFFGDNLEVLEEKIPDNFFDLIYLDPPFNSNRNYNVLFKEGQIDSSAQIHAFEDTWEWTDSTVKLFNALKENSNPQVSILINSLYEFIKATPMMAYLVNMTARLIPLRRALKDTGSIYLHCDPTASHYLKILMDVVFDKANFKNEIVWTYRRWPSKTKSFQRMHDILLFYTKNYKSLYTFNTIYQPLSDITVKIHKGKRQQAVMIEGKRFSKDQGDESRGTPIPDYWYIPAIAGNARERLGYPTQKPEELLERIIKASSNEGDWVLDPFCGCGTTVAVAERLKRNWIGIDISMQAINVIKHRMKSHFPKIKIDIDGIPMDFASAEALAERDKFSFQDWAITLVSANPPSGESKKGADRGVDGLVLFYDRVDLQNQKLRKIIVQVKGGGTNRGDVAKLKGDIEREGAPMGILITLREPTSEMKREAVLAGEYKYTESTSFPKIQILSINDWFDGRTVKLPSDTMVNPFKRAQEKEADQDTLF
ncbi:MAG: DNA methyltransferase [Patescibacteria group bacterium]